MPTGRGHAGRALAAITPTRPPDDAFIESTELSGKHVFEEVANLADVWKMREPLKERLVGLAGNYG